MAEQNKRDQKQNPKKRSKRSIILWIAGITAGLVLLVFLILPAVLSSAGGTNFLLNRVNSSLNGKIDLKDLSFGWFKGISIREFSFEDTAGTTRLDVESITADPALLGLLSGYVSLGKTVIDKPRLVMTVDPSAEKKPEPERQKTVKPDSEKPSKGMVIGPMDLEIKEGSATIRQTGAENPAPLQIKNFASQVQLAGLGKPSAMNLSMQIAGAQGVSTDSTIRANGTMTPAAQGDFLEGLEGQFELEIDSLSLESLRPLLSLAGKDMDIAGLVNAQANIRIAEGQLETLNADARVDNFRQTLGDKQTILDDPITAKAQISRSGENIQIDALSVQSSFCKLDGRGGMNQLDYTLQADLQKTQDVVGSMVDFGGYELAGQLSGSGRVEYADPAVTVQAQNTFQAFSLKKDDSVLTPSTMQVDVDLTADTKQRQLDLRSAAVAMEAGTLNVQNSRIGWGDQRVGQVELAGQMDLEKLRSWVDFFNPLPEDVRIRGMMRPDVKVEIQGDLCTVRSENTRIDNLAVIKRGLEPFVSKAVTLKADAKLDLKEKQLDELSAFELVSDQIKLKGHLKKTLEKNQQQIQGQVDAEYDLKEVSKLASPFLPQGLTMEGKRNDRFEFQSQYPADQPDQMMAHLAASGKFGFDKAEYMGLIAGPTEIQLNAKQGNLAIDLPDAKVNEGTLRFAGDIDLTAEQKMLRLRKPTKMIDQVKINDAMTQALLVYINPVFAGAVRVNGIADFSCETLAIPLGGTVKEAVDIQGNIGIDQLTMQAGDFMGQILRQIKTRDTAQMKIYPTDFTLQKGLLSYSNMQIDIGSTPLFFGGQADLMKDQLDMEMKIPLSISGEKMTLALPITGPVKKPSVNFEGAVQNAAEQFLQGELRRQIEKLF